MKTMTRTKGILFIAVLLCSMLFSAELFGQTIPVQLGVALTKGDVTMSVTGNGNSSGLSVEGTLRNNTSTEISISVELSGGLYLENSGPGQNMLAVRIFPSNTITHRDDRYIRIPANLSVGITFEAYCVDLEKPNPTKSEKFRVGIMPTAVLSFSQQISKYSATVNFDLIKSFQLLLWKMQGKNKEEIENEFKFGVVDWEIAAEILSF